MLTPEKEAKPAAIESLGQEEDNNNNNRQRHRNRMFHRGEASGIRGGVPAQIDSLDEYNSIKDKLDAVNLLHSIKRICFNFQSQKFTAHAIVHEAQRCFYLLSHHQEQNMTCATYYLERFKNAVDVIEHWCGGSIGGSIGGSSAICKVALAETEDTDTSTTSERAARSG